TGQRRSGAAARFHHGEVLAKPSPQGRRNQDDALRLVPAWQARLNKTIRSDERVVLANPAATDTEKGHGESPARRSRKFTMTSKATRTSPGRIASSGRWLTPPGQRRKSIVIGVSPAITAA